MGWWFNCLATFAAWRGRRAVKAGDLGRFGVWNKAFKRFRARAG
jgi:hypothetical protein